MEALPLHGFPPKPVFVNEWKRDYLSFLFGNDSDRSIVPDDSPINRPLQLSRLRWCTAQNTPRCVNHQYLIAEVSLESVTLGYLRLESLCCDPTTREVNLDAVPPNTAVSNLIESLSELSTRPPPTSAASSTGLEPLHRNLSDIALAPSHSHPISIEGRPPSSESQSTSSNYASVVSQPQGFDPVDNIILELDWSSPDTNSDVRPFTLLDLAFLADVVDMQYTSTGGEEHPICHWFASAVVGVVDLVRAPKSADTFSSPPDFNNGAGEEVFTLEGCRTLNALRLRDCFYETRDPIYLDNALRRLVQTTDDYNGAIETLQRANQALNEALQGLERAVVDAQEYTERANKAAKEAIEARERAAVAQQELEALLAARNERDALDAETISKAYEAFWPTG